MTQTESLDILDTLFETYHVDQAHARHVADAALALFDATAETHGLGGAARRLLELGALLHNVGLHSNPEQHHLVGRDIVLAQSLPDIDDNERALVACMVAFHRKKVRPKVEPAFLSLGKRNQETALWLAALVRVADGLDYSETQTTSLVHVEPTEHGLVLHLNGPHAAGDGARTVAKADLWHKVSGQELHCVVVGAPAAADGASEETQPETTAERPANTEDAQPPPELAHTNGAATPMIPAPLAVSSVASTTRLADYGRQLLRRYFRRMLSEERGVQADKGPEAVHQLRVASRRLRATTGLLAEVAPAKPLRRFSKTIKQIANEAAGVRDADVFLAQVATYAEGLADDGREQVQPLVEALQRDRAAARERLLALLDGERHAEFKREFASFMTDSGEDWNMRLRIRDLAGSSIWRHYEALRAHESALDFAAPTAAHALALHEARIDGKRLRYVLDFFEEVLGERASTVVEPLVALQDYLGALQDIEVATSYVAGLHVADDARPGLDAYRASRENERAALLAGLPQRWDKVMSGTYRRRLMELIVKL